MENNNLRVTLGVVVGSLVLIGAVVGLVLFFDTPDQVAVEATLGDEGIRNPLGVDNAMHTIVEFSDFECPACKAAVPGVKRFINDYSDQVQINYRHFPLPQHQNSRLAAYAAEAAAEQGLFWETHDWLFENQGKWSGRDDVDAEYFYNQFGEDLELDEEKFISDYDSDFVSNRVANDLRDGQKLGVNATPTFFIDGVKKSGALSYEVLVELTGVE